MTGILTLIPTPLDDDAQLEPSALAALAQAAADERTLILAEESRPARRRWLNWGLPREAIKRFINFNEHTSTQQTPLILAALQKGQNAVLFSDTGMPAFCDPGTALVAFCHQAGIKVTATYFPQSMVLAYALAGFGGPFYFAGMLQGRSTAERQQHLRQLLQRREGIILYDTPYRFIQLGRELAAVNHNRYLCLACDLATKKEEIFWGKSLPKIWRATSLDQDQDHGKRNQDKVDVETENRDSAKELAKREFVVVLAPAGYKLPPLAKVDR